MAEKQQETADERAERIEKDMRAERNALAHDVSPQAGEELAEGSDARKAKIKEAEDGRKERDAKAKK